jgi:hypothetical protein
MAVKEAGFAEDFGLIDGQFLGSCGTLVGATCFANCQ